MLSPRTTYRLIGGLSGAPFGTRTGRAGDLFDELHAWRYFESSWPVGGKNSLCAQPARFAHNGLGVVRVLPATQPGFPSL